MKWSFPSDDPYGHRPEYETTRDRPGRCQRTLWRVSRNEFEYDYIPGRAAVCASWQERHGVCTIAVRVLTHQGGLRHLRPRYRALRYEFHVRAGRRRDRPAAGQEVGARD